MAGYGKGESGKGQENTAPQVLGAVQQAFGAQEKGLDKIFEAMTITPEFEKEFGECYNGMSQMEQKLLSIKTLLPTARKKAAREAEANSKKRKGILDGYRGKAAGKGIPWKESVEKLENRGMTVWEQERREVTNEKLVYPAYWEMGGAGTLHSYDAGNCCWEQAFDCTLGAYELVHAHHFPEVPAQECFFKLHRELDTVTLSALQGQPPKLALDVGCGTGTSTFSLRETLNTQGHEACHITALDLSTYYVAVANHRLKGGDKKDTPGGLTFKHGNALQTGFNAGEVDIFMASAVTHEMPEQASEHLIAEAARVLRPGGVLGYFDLNPVQLLRDNPVSNLVDRIAIANEPFFDEFLAFNFESACRKNGLEIVEMRSTNVDKWPEWEDCSCRMIVARKEGDCSL